MGPEARRWVTLALILLAVPAAFFGGLSRVQVDSDVLASLPEGRERLARARQVLRHHPALEQVVLDLETEASRQAELPAVALRVEGTLRDSGLFARVGLGEGMRDFAGLWAELPARLPLLFDEAQLRGQVSRRLEKGAIRARLRRALVQLGELEGVGRAEMLAADPLGLHELALVRLKDLSPTPGARVRSGQLFSPDGRHVLILAEPKLRGADTDQARKIEAVVEELRRGLGQGLRLRALGSWRAALDNERMARADTERAVWIATLGILFLLLLCFPRPCLGVLSLLPALAGMSLALLVYSLLQERISALALGFGGALVAITVDHGIAFLQFLDSGQVKDGRQAARRVWSVGLFASLTTMGAFASLLLSGFAILAQVGLFAALGVGFSFAFVHLFMPSLLPRAPRGRRKSLLPVQSWLQRLATVRSPWPALVLALGAVAGLFILGLPAVRVDLASMNSVSRDTREAERALEKTWGRLGQGPSVMLEADSLESLLEKGSDFQAVLRRAQEQGLVRPLPGPWDLAPRGDLAKRRLESWRNFFDTGRRRELEASLRGVGEELGFAPGAFAPFVQTLQGLAPEGAGIPEGVLRALGVVRDHGRWRWFGSLQPGPAYEARALAALLDDAHVAYFEPTLFSRELGSLLEATFLRMVALVGLAVLLLLLLLFADVLLVAITALPLLAAGALSLLGLRLLGRPLDLPALMLAVVVLGMGVDYALYLVRGQQRFFDARDPGLGPVRVTVLLAGGSTLVGMLSLLSAQHAVPRSAGISSSMGIAAALVLPFLLLPPLLNRIFRPRPFPDKALAPGSKAHARALHARYAHLPPGQRFFARFKLAADPMFPRLAEWLEPGQRVLDLGCGLGVPATWLALAFEGLRVDGLEPREDAAAVAARALGERGRVRLGAAPQLDECPGPYDGVLMLDMAHHLDDGPLAQTLQAVAQRLRPGGRLILRASLSDQGRDRERRVERWRQAWRGKAVIWRSRDRMESALSAAGLTLDLCEATAPGRSEWWFVARAPEEGA